MVEQAAQNPKDKWILRYFVIFFAVVAILDGIFVYLAVSTQTGVVTQHPYEKGLVYNEVLEKARTQPQIENTVSYEKGTLRWKLPMDNAKVSANFIRPVKDGYDFEIELDHLGGGVYEIRPDLPLKGRWTAKLSAKWDNNEYQTSHSFIAR